MEPPQEVVRRPQAQPQVPDKLGELLVRSGKINQTQLNKAGATVAMIDPTNVFARADVNV